MATKRDSAIDVLTTLAKTAEKLASMLQEGKTEAFKFMYSSTIRHLINDIEQRYKFSVEEPLEHIVDLLKGESRPRRTDETQTEVTRSSEPQESAAVATPATPPRETPTRAQAKATARKSEEDFSAF